jgi:hypothetical protein
MSKWWWLPWKLAAQNRRALTQLQHQGLSESDARLFVALCRAGMPTPEWLARRLRAAADVPDTRRPE